jgi:hypothetical protein
MINERWCYLHDCSYEFLVIDDFDDVVDACPLCYEEYLAEANDDLNGDDEDE